MNKLSPTLNKKITIFKKKLSILKMSRLLVQLIFLYFFSGLITLAFSGFKSICLALFKEDFNFVNAFAFLTSFAIVVFLSIFIGRFFCGWMCAFGTFNDLVFRFSQKAFKKKFKLPEQVDNYLKYIKYVILIGIIIFIWSMNLSFSSSINPWDAFAQLPQFNSMVKEIPLAFISLGFITVGAMFIERFFCRYLCPLGAVLSITSKFKIMKINKPTEKCGKCRLCSIDCPMGINLSKVQAVDSGECISCFNCVDICPRSNPHLILFKKLNFKWYSSTTAALLIFSFLFWGSKLLKPVSKIGSNITAAQLSDADKSMYNDGVYIGAGTGFRPNLKVQVTIEKGLISDIQIISHGETTGYYEQAFAIVPKEIIAKQSTDVDTISGATKSSNGIKSAVKDALNQARKPEFVDSTTDTTNNEEKKDEIVATNISADVSMDKNVKFKDGTYTGVGTGFQPGLTVSVTISTGKISSIQILSNNETPGFRENAFSVIPKAIIEAQSTNVDVVSGATFSSKGIMMAVKNALQKAIINGELPTTPDNSTTNNVNNVLPNVSNLPVYTGDKLYKDGVYSGIGNGFQPNIKVSVTVADGAICEIKVLSHNETPGFYENAFYVVTNEILSKQATNVDTVSGATKSSNGLIHAVDDALKSAKLDTTVGENQNNNSGNNTQTSPSNDGDTNDTTVYAIHSLYKDGIYTGIGTGRKNNLIVDVTIKDNKITDINLISYRENLQYIKDAMAPMSQKIIEAQSTNVDVVSGATETSNGIKDAVNKALAKALYKDGTFNGTGRGYNKKTPINLNVTIKDGKIADIDLVSHDETQSYFDNAWPTVLTEIIEKQSTTVDTVSGATRSSNGIISAAKAALSSDVSVGETSTYPSDEDIIAPFRDGIYTGVENGYRENLNVIVTIKNNTIIKIDLGTNNETPKYFNNAWPTLPNAIISKQSTDVDAISGATRSSIGIINAVKDALRKSKLALTAEPEAPYKDGTYRGIARGYRDGLNLDVTIKDNKIISIDIKENNETQSYFQKAWLPVSTSIIENQTTKVDTISGATRSSNGIIAAVNDALRKSHDTTLNLEASSLNNE